MKLIRKYINKFKVEINEWVANNINFFLVEEQDKKKEGAKPKRARSSLW